jgi:hypothetical protein
MPSRPHDALIEIFRHRPQLLLALLALVAPGRVPDVPGAILLPAPGEVTSEHHEQHRTDLVLLRMIPGAAPAHAFILEVQLAPDPRKDFTWPVYAAGIGAREQCPVTLVVLALDERTARWAAALHSRSGGGSTVMTPLVIGPAQIPRITDLAEARASPEMAVLSAAAHGRTRGAEHIAHAAILACAALDTTHRTLYVDAVIARLGKRARRALEENMPLQRFVPQSDIGKKIYAEGRTEGLREGREEGLKKGRREGLREGRSKGLEEGRNAALRSLLVKQIRRRFGRVPRAAMSRIRGAEPDLLERWCERLLSASSLDDVLDGEG